jgi:hypothetical protein
MYYEYNSEDMTSCSCNCGSLVGLWDSSSRLLELTVADHNSASNSVTAIDAGIRDLYVAEAPSTESAAIDISALFDPDTNDTGEDIHYTIQRSDGLIVDDDDFGSGSAKLDEVLPVTDTARDYAIIAWLDENGNGVCDSGEDKRQVYVHVVDLNSDNNDDGAVDATDDALNALYPTALNLEGNGQRTEVELSIGAPNGSGCSYEVVVPNVAGVEFWTAATGGTQLMPDVNGNIIDTSLSGVSGQYTRTLWVSAASTVVDADDSPGGDATIQLQVRDQTGRAVTKTNIAVNKPIEILYAFDGTTNTAASNTVVRQLFNRFAGIKHYYEGPDLRGTKGPSIFQQAEDDILSDAARAESRNHRKLVIDMTGYSRGAIIAATVAKDLLTTHMINGTPQVLSVHWMGLFDPVSLFAGIKPKSGLSWATTVPQNVQVCDCAIKNLNMTRLLKTDPGYYLYKEDQNVIGTVGGTIKKFSLNHSQLGHSTTVLGWMIKQAHKARVPGM